MGLLGCWVVGSATPTATTATPPNQHQHQHHQHHQQHTNNTTNTNNTNKAKKTTEHQKNEKKKTELPQNWPRRGPEASKNGGKIEKKALHRPKWPQVGPKGVLTQCPSSILDHFGVPSGAPKSTKSRSLAGKVVPGALPKAFFIDFAGHRRFCLAF